MTDGSWQPAIEGAEHPTPSWFCSYFLVEMSRATNSPLVDDGLPWSAVKLARIVHAFDRATYALPGDVGYSGMQTVTEIRQTQTAARMTSVHKAARPPSQARI